MHPESKLGTAVAGTRSPADTGLFAELLVKPTAGVVHDLGNLIQIASSAMNVLARSPNLKTAPALERAVASARISLERAGDLVRQSIGRAHERRMAMDYVSVSECLAEIETLVRDTWEPAIRLDVQTSPNLPLTKCNRLDLQNAVLNLLFNARDALPDGGSISIVATEASRGPDVTEIELRIADNGLGMTPETVRRAFDPFFTTKCTGLGGVGLPMVKRFVQEAGGRVDIESERGVGTTVTLRLPVAAPPTTRHSARPAIDRPNPVCSQSPRSG